MMETPPFCVTLVLVITVATIELYQADGQQFKGIKPPCICPGDVLKFSCSTVGPAFTTWKGSALQCPPQDNQIVIIHRQFNDTKECGSATARGISITGISNNYNYTSQLNITFGDALNDTDIQCLYDNGTTQTLIGSDIIMSAGTLPPPDTIFVANISSQEFIFHWNPVFPECQHVTYSITSSNCGDCLNTSSTSVTCSNFNVSTNATICTLTVRSIVCANIVGDEATSVSVLLKVPISPIIIGWVPQYSNDSGTLTQITIQFRETDYFRISDGIDGTAQSYNIIFCNESDCSFNIVDASVCVTEGSCTHEISVSTTFHYIKTNVSVRVAAVNQFGTGPNSSPIIVDAANNIVEVKLDSSKTIICSFMNQQVQNISCNITYWLCSEPKTIGEINAYGDTEDVSTNRVSIPVAPNLLDGEYCYTIYAGYDNSSIRVKGTFEFTTSTSGVVDYKIIISTTFIAVLMTIIILLMSPYVNKLKSKFNRSDTYSQLLHLCSSFICNRWCRHKKCKHCMQPKLDKNGVTNYCKTCGFTYCTCTGDSNELVTHSEYERFKIILAEKDTSLSSIIEEKGLVYKRGRAYYEFVRDNEIISEGKEVILMKKDMKSLCSSPEARLIIGVRDGECKKPKLMDWPKVFIQSNGTGARFIGAGTRVLYDCKGLGSIYDSPPREAVIIDSNQFKRLQVRNEDQELDKFVQKMGYEYKVGLAYYEFTLNKEDIPEGREVILMDKKTEIMYTGRGVCEMIKAPGNDIEPPSDELRIQYRVFVQSRSPGNRHLRAGTLLLYKITEDSTNTPTDTEEQSFPRQVVVIDGDEHDMQLQEVTKYMDIFPVTKDCELRKFIKDKRGRFERGLAYYQFVRETEDIYDDTNVVVMDQETRKLYIDPISKPIMIHRRGRDIERPDQEKYIVFVQSNTTGSRLLEAGTQVLYKRAKVD